MEKKKRRGGGREEEGGGGGEEEEETEEEEEEDEINVCTLTCVYSDLQYLPVLPTFLSYSSCRCPYTSAAKCLYQVTGTVDG